jgi:hypothetical protein
VGRLTEMDHAHVAFEFVLAWKCAATADDEAVECSLKPWVESLVAREIPRCCETLVARWDGAGKCLLAGVRLDMFLEREAPLEFACAARELTCVWTHIVSGISVVALVVVVGAGVNAGRGHV